MLLTIDFRHFDIGEGMNVLDAGCGQGRHSFYCLTHDCSVFSTDLSGDELKAMKSLLVDRRKNHKDVVGDAMIFRSDIFKLPFSDESMDRIICAEVLEHLHEDEKGLKELVRVLKPGGKMAITVPTWMTENMYKRLSREYFRTPGGHVRIFTQKELSRKIKSAGLNIYNVTYAHAFHTPYWVLKCIVGLHNDEARLPKYYHKFLFMSINSKPLKKAERFLNKFFPKSVVFYAKKSDAR